jgi:hypothetical protein
MRCPYINVAKIRHHNVQLHTRRSIQTVDKSRALEQQTHLHTQVGMAATIATSLVASQLMLLLCTTATATVPLPGFPAVVDGAVPPTPATVAGGSGLPKLPFPFPAGQSRLPSPGNLPHLLLPLPNGPPDLRFPLPRGNNLAYCLNALHQAESYVADCFNTVHALLERTAVTNHQQARVIV